MITTTEVLDSPEICMEIILYNLKYKQDTFDELTIDDVILKIKQAMIAYAEHVRDEDRKIVAEKARVYAESEGKRTSSTVTIKVSKPSIINAPKLELK